MLEDTSTIVPTNGAAESTGTKGVAFRDTLLSLSKNFQNTPVSGIIEETGVLLWKAGEKMHGEKQSLWI